MGKTSCFSCCTKGVRENPERSLEQVSFLSSPKKITVVSSNGHQAVSLQNGKAAGSSLKAQFSNRAIFSATSEQQSHLLPGEDRARVSMRSKDSSKNYEESFSMFEEVSTLYDPLRRGMKESNNGRCLGWRPDGQDSFQWLSYKSVISRSVNFGKGLKHIGVKEKDFVGIYCKNRIEWIFVEQGLFSFSMVSVPLYENLEPAVCQFIIREAELVAIVVQDDKRLQALLLDLPPCLKIVIHLEDLEPGTEKRGQELGLKLYKFEQVEKIGKDRKGFYNEQPPKPEDIAVLNYTSGTTNAPKGIILTHKNIIASASASLISVQTESFALTSNDVLISYMPLAHVYPKMIQVGALMVGASIGFAGETASKMIEDIKILKPTIFPCVPRALNQIYTKIMTESNSSKWKRFLLKEGLKRKSKEFERGIRTQNTFWDKHVFDRIREEFGGRVRLVLKGGGDISGEIMQFFRVALGCAVLQGYGTTETSGATTATLPSEPGSGHVGPPIACAAMKLSDVPALNLNAWDDIGEICVKGPHVCSGYYKDPIATYEVFDVDGWMHTREIGMWLPNGALVVIDRQKYIFTTPEGHYVAPEWLESIYSLSHHVDQIFIYGPRSGSTKSFLVAIIVPNPRSFKGPLASMDLPSLCSSPEAKSLILKSFSKLAAENGLFPHERIQKVHLHPQPFTLELGLLTPTMKAKRQELAQFFAEQIRELYSTNLND